MSYEPEVRKQARKALTCLEECGWTQGKFQDEETGAVCITWAIFFPAHGTHGSHLLDAVKTELRFPDREPLASWNDDPKRTYADVRGVLLRVIRKKP